jgi:reverse gyrase
VDSILKSARKIDIVLKFLGIDEETINLALELIEKKDYVKLMELNIEKKRSFNCFFRHCKSKK